MTTFSQVVSGLDPTTSIGMLAGLFAAYGRELSMRRRPHWRWWLSRILLLPAAAIASAAIESPLGLSSEAKALMVMLAVFRGYDGLKLLAKGHGAWPRDLSGRR